MTGGDICSVKYIPFWSSWMQWECALHSHPFLLVWEVEAEGVGILPFVCSGWNTSLTLDGKYLQIKKQANETLHDKMCHWSSTERLTAILNFRKRFRAHNSKPASSLFLEKSLLKTLTSFFVL